MLKKIKNVQVKTSAGREKRYQNTLRFVFYQQKF